MNTITARFAAMAERVRQDEAGVAQGPQSTRAIPGRNGGWTPPASDKPAVAVPATRTPGASSCGPEQRGEPNSFVRKSAAVGSSTQSILDQQVADELASLDRDDPPPPAIDPHDGPLRPKTDDARGRAIAYVSRLIDTYRAMRRSPGSYKVGLTGKIGHLTKELAMMQSMGDEGATLARRWDFVVGDGKGGQYGYRGIA